MTYLDCGITDMGTAIKIDVCPDTGTAELHIGQACLIVSVDQLKNLYKALQEEMRNNFES